MLNRWSVTSWATGRGRLRLEVRADGERRLSYLVCATLLCGAILHATPAAAVDLWTKKLPPSYNGDDFDRFFKSIQVAPKSEFETTSAYEARLAAASGVGPKTRAFRVRSPEISYHADSQELIVGVTPDGTGKFTLSERSVAHREYVGQNSFGVKAMITEETRHRRVLVDAPQPASPGMTAEITMPPAKARIVKPLVRVVIVCAPGSDAAIAPVDGPIGALGATDSDYKSPTLTSPYETITYDFGLRARVLGFLVYRADTGEVLARVDDSGARLPVDPTAQQVRAAGDAKRANEEATRGDRNFETWKLIIMTGIDADDVTRNLGAPDEVETVVTASGRFENLEYGKRHMLVRIDSETRKVVSVDWNWTRPRS